MDFSARVLNECVFCATCQSCINLFLLDKHATTEIEEQYQNFSKRLSCVKNFRNQKYLKSLKMSLL